jgi:hypothetical protein
VLDWLLKVKGYSAEMKGLALTLVISTFVEKPLIFNRI